MNAPNRLGNLLQKAIDDGIFPGACYAAWQDETLITGAVGHFTYSLDSSPVTLDTIWDLASLSKVVGTTTAVMLLVQEGRFDLDQTVASIIPEFGVSGKERITFRNLMIHDAGLVAYRAYHETYSRAEDVMNAIYTESLTYETGTEMVYSDLSMILVAEAIHRITGQALDEFLCDRVFRPLGINHTGYFRRSKPTFLDSVSRNNCSPTESIEPWREALRQSRGTEELFGDQPKYIQGEVHDPTATILGGVAGHAGLFSTIGDLVRFMTCVRTLVTPIIWSEFTRRQEPKSTRGLGWDTKSEQGSSAGTKFGPRSYGHTGYTGTSIWFDPDADTGVILLTNRVHPSSENKGILSFRPIFHDSVVEILRSVKARG